MVFYSTLIQANVHLCNKTFGPGGQTECILSSRYQEYQCATCLTNAYIELKSGGRHHCDNKTPYCLYECQKELFGKDEGVVDEKCRCKVNETRSSRKTSLPPSCYSPTGTDCHWYQDCLQRQFSCSGTSADYSIKYAAHFCAAYGSTYFKISTLGKNWVDSVRQCLQVSLAPLQRKCNSDLTCNFVQDTAFRSQDCCYLGGDKCTPTGAPSMCAVSVKDWFTVFIKIKEAFNQPKALETFQNALRVGFQCIKEDTHSSFQSQENIIKGWLKRIFLVFKYPEGNNLRKKRAIDDNQFQQNNRFAVTMIEKMSKELEWDETKLAWFVSSSKTTGGEIFSDYPDDRFFRVDVILVDKLAKTSGASVSVLLYHTYSKFLDNAKRDRINQIESQNLVVVVECTSIRCNRIRINKVPQPIPSNVPTIKKDIAKRNLACLNYTTKSHFVICFLLSLISFYNL